MAFTLTEFKSNLKQGGARPALFTVDLNYPTIIEAPPTASRFLIKGATIPASTIGTHEVFFHGKPHKIAGDRTFDTWDTTIINDEDYGIRIALEKWMDLISDHKLNTRNRERGFNSSEGENASYKTRIKVTQFSKSGKELHHYHFIGAFPTALSTINLDWGTSEIEEYTCTWTYERWMPGTKAVAGLTSTNHLLASESHGN